MNDYGFKPRMLWQINSETGTEPAFGDVYDPLSGPCKGNSNCLIGAST